MYSLVLLYSNDLDTPVYYFRSFDRFLLYVKTEIVIIPSFITPAPYKELFTHFKLFTKLLKITLIAALSQYVALSARLLTVELFLKGILNLIIPLASHVIAKYTNSNPLIVKLNYPVQLLIIHIFV